MAGSPQLTPGPPLFLAGFPLLQERLVEWVAAVRERRPSDEVTVVVGSGPAAAQLGRLLTRGLGAHVGVRVEPIHSLAAALAARGAAAAAVRPLSAAGRERIVVSLVRAAPRAGWYFAPIRETPGLPAALARTFDDLREAGLGSSAVAGLGGRKARELAALYGAYVDVLERNRLADDAALYEFACRAADGSVNGGALAFYGLYDLPEMQVRLVRALAAGERPRAAFVPYPAGVAAFAEPTRGLFEAGGFVAEVLDGGARDDGLGRFRAALAGGGVGGEAAPAPNGSLRIVSVADQVEQAREVVRRVLAELDAGLPAHEVAVVAQQRESRRRIAGALRDGGLEVAARLPHDGLGARACRLLLDCLAPASGPALARGAVVSLAAAVANESPGSDAALVARWDRISRRARIVGGAAEWRERLSRAERESRHADDEDDEADAGAGAAAAADDVAAVRALRAFVDRLAADARRLPARGSWSRYVSETVRAVERLTPAAHDDAGLEALRALAELDTVEPQVSCGEFAATAGAAVAAAEESVGAVGRHGVAVVSPEQLRGLEFSTVVFCDLAEGGFPVRPQADVILRDGEREALAVASGARLPTSRSRDAESLLLFALALEAARERALLVVPRRDAGSARPRLPSRFVLAAARALAGRVVFAEELSRDGGVGGLVTRAGEALRQSGDPEAPVSVGAATDQRDYDVSLLSELRAGGAAAPAAAERYTAAVVPAAARRRGALRAAQARSLTAWDGRLGAAHAALALDLAISGTVSPSALQDYFVCPFAFFLRRVIGLRALEAPAGELLIEPSQLGTIAHAILERAFAAVAEGGEAAPEAALAALETAAAKRFALAEREGVTGYPLAWAVRREQLLADLRTAVAADPCWSDGRLPRLMEWSFGDDEDSAVALEVEGRQLRLRGRVDRIDQSPDGAEVRLVDYKTGRVEVERARVREGRALQLLVYALAAASRHEGAEISPVYRFVTRRGGFATLPLGLTAAEAREALAGLLAGLLAALSAGLYPRWPGERRCESCDLVHGCSPEALGLGRKRDDEALAPLVALRGDGD